VGDRPLVASGRSFVDLHCHTSASFDCLSDPARVVEAAAKRGITHLAITDHDRIDGALSARTVAPEELTVIVGEEIRSADGDVVGLFLQEAIPPGLTAEETVAAIHAQGGLAGVPHPFDRLRGSGVAVRHDLEVLERIASRLDYLETFNSRVPFGDANDRAAVFAHERGVPGIAVSDAHFVGEVGISYMAFDGPVDSADGLRAALAGEPAAMVMQRASILMRGLMPVSKAVQRMRGNRRVPPAVRGS